MPRPKLHSDETVLAAALAVLLRKGPTNFTLTDVATEIGMSRAALIQRFGDKLTLHRKVREHMTHEMHAYFDALDPVRFGVGLAPLWDLLRDLISGMGAGEDTPGYLLLNWADIADPVLLELARDGAARVLHEIAIRLPPDERDAVQTARLIEAVIQGACMQWLIHRDGALVDYMTGQTRLLLQTLYPGHDFP